MGWDDRPGALSVPSSSHYDKEDDYKLSMFIWLSPTRHIKIGPDSWSPTEEPLPWDGSIAFCLILCSIWTSLSTSTATREEIARSRVICAANGGCHVANRPVLDLRPGNSKSPVSEPTPSTKNSYSARGRSKARSNPTPHGRVNVRSILLAFSPAQPTYHCSRGRS